MSIADVSLIHVLILILGYWVVAVLVFRMRARKRALAKFETMERVSQTERVVTFTETISLGRVAAVALLPPVLLLLVWLVTRP